MSNHAYKDKERKQIVYAEDCTINDSSTRYYCHNTECDAHVKIKAINTEVKPHFWAPKPCCHQLWCKHPIKIFTLSKQDEEKFEYNTIIDSILNLNDASIPSAKQSKESTKRSSNGNSLEITNLEQIYHLCKTMKHTALFNGMEVWKMLYDDRCNYILTRGLSGKHIIECYYHHFDPKLRILFFKYPMSELGPNQYTLRVSISDDTLFKHLKNKVFSETKYPLVIVGDWKKFTWNGYECQITSRLQLYIP